MSDSLDKSNLVAIREVVADDKAFILATFLRGLYYGDGWFRDIPKDIFMKEYHKLAEHLLTKEGTQIVVACLREDHDVILSYAILGWEPYAKSPNKLHFVFTKSAWRKIGLAKSLVPNTINTVTHLTKTGQMLMKKHPSIIFNPFAL
jgi:hypothetical protein